MSKPIIEVKNISKRYIIAKREPYVTLRDSVSNFFKFRKKRTTEIEFWALKDINLKVEQGEIIGVIGANGAGKTTLLKILSQITPPTTGQAILRGRVASLLEVGTGFHPELSGKENIFLSGITLGMKRREIIKKYDEIVEFAGVEKFLDTPVKRYSSGMYVRLAFAVASHLEPEILLIDEVLAVGDVKFQKKCLGKMDEVTKQAGRTIFFVSHNMGQIKKLCKRVILIDEGGIKRDGDPESIVNEYVSSSISLVSHKKQISGSLLESNEVDLKSYSVYGEKPGDIPRTGKPLNIELDFKFKEPIINPGARVYIRNLHGFDLMYLNSTPLGGTAIEKGEGTMRFKLTIDELMLTGGPYVLVISMFRVGLTEYLKPTEIGQFEVQPDDYYSVGIDLHNTKVGFIVAKHKWDIQKIK